MDYAETDEFIRKLDELSPQDFQDSFYPTNKSVAEYEQFLKHARVDREKLLQNPFCNQNYHIFLHFISNLINDGLYDPLKNSNFDDLYDKALKFQTRIIYDDFCTKLDSFKNGIIDQDWICSSYQKIFEQTCKSFFKFFASKIKNNEINSCATALSIISKHDKNMNIILTPFDSHIRNCVTHHDWYFDKKQNLLIFDDLKKSPVKKSIKEISKSCKEMMINEACFYSADFTIIEDYVEASLNDSKSCLELLDFLDCDSNSMLKLLLSKGYSVKSIKIVLENHIRESFFER